MAKRNSLIESKRLQAQLEKFYKKGNSMQTSADEFQLPFGTVRHFLSKRNLLRPRGPIIPPVKHNKSQSDDSPAGNAVLNQSYKAERDSIRNRKVAKRRLVIRRNSKLTSTTLTSDGNTSINKVNGPTENGRQSTVVNGKSNARESRDVLSLAECQTNYDEFVKAFAVPTHLYRYLASRSNSRPLYLNRNLSYMRAPVRTPSHNSSKNKKRSIEDVVSHLLSMAHISQPEQQNGYQRSIFPGQSPSRTPNRGKIASASPKSDSGNLKRPRSPIVQQHSPTWPDELELVVEGFFDSEKENDWVTVEAKLSVQSRFGWAWKRKSLQRDSIVLLNKDIDVACNNKCNNDPSPASSSRFRPADLLEAVRRSRGGVGVRRLNTGQLELRIRAKERRRAKRINGCTSDTLGHSSYIVQYSTAPLPLFYTDVSTDALDSPLLLSPGLYELRLGIETESVDCPQSQLLTSNDDNKSKLTCVAAQSAMSVDGAAPGQLDWNRVRFPKVSAAVDEYARWPRLQFRVIWHTNSKASVSSAVLLKSPRNRQNGGSNRLEASNCTSPKSPGTTNKTGQKRRSCSGDSLYSQPSPLQISSDNNVIHPTLLTFPLRSSVKELHNASSSSPIFVTYRFIYSKGLQQWSETQDLLCPWCKLNCRRGQFDAPASALLAHLRTCHPRFRFKANWSAIRAHLSLEVSLNESYDGSNDCGVRSWNVASRHADTAIDLSIPVKAEIVPTDCHLGAFNNNPLPVVGGWTGLLVQSEDTIGGSHRTKTTADIVKLKQPSRRLPYTHLIYWRGADRMVQQSLDPTISVRPLAVGHNRVYYHTSTMIPIVANNFDEDSEGEDAPSWLRQHYHRKVEEFTDVNEGEKKLMQTWNAHLLSVKPTDSVVCDSQMENIVASFVTTYANWMHQQHLRTNLILHLANLVDYGIVSPKLMSCALDIFNTVKTSMTSS